MSKNENYYIDTIKINDWLVEDLTDVRSQIIFAYKTEYYLGSQLHNEEGAAVEYFNKNNLTQQENQYYLFGKRYESEKEWKIDAIKLSRKEKIKNIFINDNTTTENINNEL